MKKFNVLGCNDQFFNRFLITWFFLGAFGMAWLNNAVPGKFGINYCMCTGENPKNYNFLQPKVSSNHIIKLTGSNYQFLNDNLFGQLKQVFQVLCVCYAIFPQKQSDWLTNLK